MISICARNFDLLGYIEFKPLADSSDAEHFRRVSRVATLDGGVAVSDKGFAEGDKTFTYVYKPISAEHDDRAKRLVKLHPTVTVSNRDGVFEAVPETFSSSPDANTITLLVTQKLSED